MKNFAFNYVEFFFASHIGSFINKSLLVVIINIVGLNEFKYTKGTNPREF